MNNIQQNYEQWIAGADESLLEELRSMGEAEKEDAFYRNLAFGTGGLRGVIGAGTNRMNVHTVAKASQGLANFVNTAFAAERECGNRTETGTGNLSGTAAGNQACASSGNPDGAGSAGPAPRIAVSYDSRILSDVFAKKACGVFAANGIEAWIYPQLMPTPCLSYAVRALGCAAGIMVTASHNPAKYNGYKVYGPDGCQITTEAAARILEEIEKLDIFADPVCLSFEEGMEKGLIKWIPEHIFTDFTEHVKKESLLGDEPLDRNVAIVYSPLNGTGLKPVLRALTESGFGNITVVKEQENPDGNFPTCPYPNPEIREAMKLGLEYAKRESADLLLATDPDCDRMGIAVRADNGDYRLLTGNETGLLLFDYVCRRRLALGRMPERPVLVKTIVTTDLAKSIAAHYGVETVDVLTGFKFIGETIGRLEAKGEEDRYIFGFEESYGYLSGTYVRDKDAVNASFLTCEMFAWYRQQGVSLLERLNELYRDYGYCLNTLHSYEFDGAKGFAHMQEVMAGLRQGINFLAGKKVEKLLDYSAGLDGLPKSDVLKFLLSGGVTVVVRPSGTEPKLKVYISVIAGNETEAMAEEERLAAELERIITA